MKSSLLNRMKLLIASWKLEFQVYDPMQCLPLPHRDFSLLLFNSNHILIRTLLWCFRLTFKVTSSIGKKVARAFSYLDHCQWAGYLLTILPALWKKRADTCVVTQDNYKSNILSRFAWVHDYSCQYFVRDRQEINQIQCCYLKKSVIVGSW